LGCVTPPKQAQNSDTIRVGALLPFTGDLAASGANIERALIWVVEQVNNAGGVAGRKLELVTRDGGSDVEVGLAAARDLVENENVIAIIGPENDDLAAVLLPYVELHEVILISGGATATSFSNATSGGIWFRTIPSSHAFAAVMAQRIYAAGAQTLAIMFENNVFGNDMATLIQNEFVANGGTDVGGVPFTPGSGSYSDVLDRISALAPQAVALVAYPKEGAAILQDMGPIVGAVKWYLAHTLYSSAFVANTPVDELMSMEGVAPAVSPDDKELFASYFANRWPGDSPLLPAYFNYDALALLALAIEAAATDAGTGAVPNAAQISQSLFRVSYSSTGKAVSWSGIDMALGLIRQQTAVNYRGASGSVDWLDSSGNVTNGEVQIWSVRDETVVNGDIVIATPLTQ
jgi:branched-chain amino acid transport system substrate-binding protein